MRISAFPYRMNTMTAFVFAAIGFLLFGGFLAVMIIMALRNPPEMSIEILFTFGIFIFFAALSLLVASYSCEGRITKQGIYIRNILGVFMIPWNEITYVHTFQGTMLIGGECKEFTLPDRGYWADLSGGLFTDYFERKLKQRKVKPVETGFFLPSFKKTRVRYRDFPG